MGFLHGIPGFGRGSSWAGGWQSFPPQQVVTWQLPLLRALHDPLGKPHSQAKQRPTACQATIPKLGTTGDPGSTSIQYPGSKAGHAVLDLGLMPLSLCHTEPELHVQVSESYSLPLPHFCPIPILGHTGDPKHRHSPAHPSSCVLLALENPHPQSLTWQPLMRCLLNAKLAPQGWSPQGARQTFCPCVSGSLRLVG